ncbi:MAG: hypothetical protein HS119_14805 [Flavobacteriales bacterium]|nr:hypothetical protein [Flavobacteriales bacterium]
MDKQIIEKSKIIGREISDKTNILFDFFREIDYFLQGRRSNLFIYGALTVVVFAPLVDYLILPRRLSLTFVATCLYLLFILVSLFAWAGKFRDENNKWSFKRFIERIQLSFKIIIAILNAIKQKDKNSQLFFIGVWIFMSGFIIKALQNISEIFRIPFQTFFSAKMGLLRTFESYTSFGFILIIIGIVIFVFLHFSKKLNLLEVFFNKEKPHVIQLSIQNGCVVNTKNKEQIKNIISSNPDSIFRATLNAISNWKPEVQDLEKDYEKHLSEHFIESLIISKNLTFDTQHRIETGKEKGIVDFCINESLFIELKRKVKSSELHRASGQVLKYQRILESSSTPLILLIVDSEYESIENKLTEFIKDYNNRHIQKILAVVVEPN